MIERRLRDTHLKAEYFMISNWRVPCYLCRFLVLMFICSEKENVYLSVHINVP